MPLTGNREAHELLLIEEADSWFEYLGGDARPHRDSLPRGRAVGLGPTPAAAPGDPARAGRG